ncbi:SDR family oxidoreductase [Paenibacillus eucommiae]|uniref:NAD(P)-dependent dehydrogenase (Short-subunit alcohol dehydrogenase family) n=1 Tax=Paenibacillus eucommiae TaxID=1355755 RepID=A0ABS4J232_9BACL|nr:SDR family oxidoreductase [Paenibacillus eucommiae]MBP1993887.1 NAD(P)-dependent dehydrogenase (short-subunit alcohol dehydrogenase family) [Paenibacillus eucommiae]
MHNKIVMITGANSGMGLATTIELAKLGARVIMVCRSRERGEAALLEAVKQSGSEQIELMLCDLASLADIRAFAEAFKAKYDVLDVLINNAGVVSIKRAKTKDGFEIQLGVNHLGHFLLTNLLLEELKRSPQGRIVNVSSAAHKSGDINFDDTLFPKGFNVWTGYARSKLANVLFTKELARRLKGTAITVNSLHPGAVGTHIGVNRESGFGKTIWKLVRPFFLSALEGSRTAIYLATSDQVADVNGEYFYKEKIAPVSKKASDQQLAEKLWIWSAKQVML